MAPQEFIDLLKKLSEAFGPSGFEDEVRDLVIRELGPYVDDLITDKWGNVIGIRYGKSRDLKAMVAAHMDEIGLLIDSIDKNGFLRFRAIGGWNEVTLVSQRVVIKTVDGRKIKGVIGGRPPHVTPPGKEREAPELKDLFMDVGASSDEEVRRLGVRVGSVAVLDRDFEVLNEGVVTGKAFDDRVGLAVMLWAARQLRDSEVTVYFVATVQEEVGLRGAQIAADRVYPDFAIALDTTIAADVPGINEREFVTRIGKGPAIKVMDGGRGNVFLAHPALTNFLVSTAEELKIPYQLEVLIGGTTDALGIAFRRDGIPATTISIPTRYVHSPVELLNIDDAINAAKLLSGALSKADEKFVQSLRENIIKVKSR
ncbi:M42 family metallopeptidase [Vulcanisaeta souniana]|uniref:Peptidase M42 n=1 Tax=Vulcanisaeta souniana JCM 11219 TaxID=1293586 RepID=A0A830E1C7_9CREN|nr:M42 family metallopeptidase [Vulcanisaeta souniana]BDR91392.1 peptidase M42 [Vulcanisaeta souniana JCM 11219]GGI72809.1 peptidase M42 [Vulcanisaeta souniana JCM 11219]